MAGLRAACVQMRSGVEIAANIAAAEALIREAAGAGAQLICTPEMTHLVQRRSGPLFEAIHGDADDPGLSRFRALAEELGVWLSIGSLAVRAGEKAANRSFLIGPDGAVAARYDKIHLFDVDLPGGESYRESKTYAAGTRAVTAETPLGMLGLTICYDLRFAGLYRMLAQAGAQILTVPAAFTAQTGAAHWHVLLRARAIETGCFVLAAAQGGTHEDGRRTYGHSLIISPWGEVLAEAAGDEPGVILADLDLAQIAEARARIPALRHGRDIAPPER